MQIKFSTRNTAILRVVFILAAVVVFAVTSARAQNEEKNRVEIVEPWARASVGTTGAIYMILRNTGSASDRLVGVSTAAAAQAELHHMTMDGDVMRMRQVETIAVPPGGTAELKPGGLHVMLINLKQPLKMGDRIMVTLKFEKAGEIPAEVRVLAVGATLSGGQHDGQGMRHTH